MSIKSQELKRADFAYSYIKKEFQEGTNGDLKKNFRSYVMNVPAFIKTNGLIATYAFIGTKMGKTDAHKKVSDMTAAYKKIYDMTAEWLSNSECSLAESIAINQNDDLKGKFLELSSSEYKLVTKEILALFNWVKRFAVSEIDTE